ncbi:hypothetical protein EDB92DRAFT_1865839 [Lactarius akahatsu]|uniref:Uncharacterized protein n=1 Tax=Lactarius akahatsu TaxID=416441 RepID=A0AAD4LG28_9AGAM|nr:hypothetical protein EDB92DRAFT_1865839 [Lactarius akahatsu]
MLRYTVASFQFTHLMMKIWLLLVDHNFQTIGDLFSVDCTGDDYIYNLTVKAKEERPRALSHTSPFMLTVWRCMDPTTSFNLKDHEVLACQISGVFSSNSVKMLGSRRTIAKLNISKNEILFVQLPGQPAITSDEVRDPLTSQVVREYEHCFLRVHTKGEFTEEDIQFNKIVDPDDRDAPEFVKKYKQTLD